MKIVTHKCTGASWNGSMQCTPYKHLAKDLVDGVVEVAVVHKVHTCIHSAEYVVHTAQKGPQARLTAHLSPHGRMFKNPSRILP